MSEPISGEVITPHEHEGMSIGSLLSALALGVAFGLAAYYLFRYFRESDSVDSRLVEAYNSGLAHGRSEVEAGNNLRTEQRTDSDSGNADTPTVVAKPRRSRGKTPVVDTDNGGSEPLE